MDVCQGPHHIDDVSPLIGHTPMLRIDYTIDGRPRRLYAKYEQENMTGSIKDRMAEYILRRAYESGDLLPGAPIVEASSGNTGISFAALGRALGHPVRIYMPNWMSQERVRLIQSLGAEIIPMSHEQGGFVGSIKMCEEYARKHEGVFLPRQFENKANIEAHYCSTGPEIEAQMEAIGERIDAFVAGVGTGGTVMGVGRYLRRNGKTVRVHPLEPANSPTLRTGHCDGNHRIQGISDEFVPSIIDLAELDTVVDVWDGDSILMAQELSRRLGLAVGISSGANFLGAAGLIERMDADAVVVTVFPDSNKKYLSTDLCRTEPAGPDYLTPRIELQRFRAMRCPI
ncbi:MAG TPA: PLP-dependent cysteine synthase family protein [Phycisphaerae bacterium]|nr:PLP-dependent cysteine synthase family protein [Phycisphaerae bacterium]